MRSRPTATLILGQAFATSVALTQLLAAMPANATITFYTEGDSRSTFGGADGPFAAHWQSTTTHERRECHVCPAELPWREPGRFSTTSGQSGRDWGIDPDGNSWDHTTSYSSRNSWVISDWPAGQMAFTATSASPIVPNSYKYGANVLQDGSASVLASAYGRWGDTADNGGFSSSSKAGWNDVWLIAPTTDHEAGSAGRLRFTLTLSGEMESNTPLGDFGGQVQTAIAQASIGSFVQSLEADWTYDPQQKAASLYVDFRYGESFAAGMWLSSAATVWEGGDWRNGMGQFEAGISEVLIPMGTTLEHSLLGLNVLNSDDPNLNPPPVPEPGTWALMFAGLAGVGFAARRRGRRQV